MKGFATKSNYFYLCSTKFENLQAELLKLCIRKAKILDWVALYPIILPLM